ncbi:MAG: hypothetical protein ACYS8Y_14545 [Planctomycetota bacterium]
MKKKKKVMLIIGVIFACVTFVYMADLAEATITDVSVIPEQPTLEDIIIILTSGVEGAGGVSIVDSNFHMAGTSLELDIFINVGFWDVITPWSHSEIIGTLPANSYDLTVTVEAYYGGSHTEINTYSTSFTVVPVSLPPIFGFLKNTMLPT